MTRDRLHARRGSAMTRLNLQPTETWGETALGVFVLLALLAVIVLAFVALAPEGPGCLTDTECMDLYGGDGGPAPAR